MIVAGYPDEMERFIDANPGLASRFSRTLTFDDYDAEELVRIVEQQAAEHEYPLAGRRPEAPCWTTSRGYRAGASFGNGRTARQVFQQMTERHATRVAEFVDPSTEELRTLVLEDARVEADVES